MNDKPDQQNKNEPSPYKDQTMPDEQWFENLTAYAKLGSELFADQIDSPQEPEPAPSESSKKQMNSSKIAPGMMMNDPLEQKAASAEIEQGNATEVTKLYVDRTPEE